jgi:hypothetical protein
MLMSIIQMSPLQDAVFATGSPCSIGADRVRTRESLISQLMMVCGQGTFFYPQSSHHDAQHPAHRPEPDASHHKQLQCQKGQIHLALEDNHPTLALKFMRTSPALFELFFEFVALRLDPGKLFALIAVLLSSAGGFLFSVIPAPFVSGLRTHSAPAQRDVLLLSLWICILIIVLTPWIMADKIQVIVQRWTQPVQYGCGPNPEH